MFWVGTLIFVGTYILIATEKINKTAAAMAGAMLMMLFILPQDKHDSPPTENAQTQMYHGTVSFTALYYYS